MKVVLRLAILVAALLLVTDMAFANGCDQELCYDIIATDEFGNTESDLWEACLNNEGKSYGHSETYNYTVDLYLFGGGP